jgi:hypothetical protein
LVGWLVGWFGLVWLVGWLANFNCHVLTAAGPHMLSVVNLIVNVQTNKTN